MQRRKLEVELEETEEHTKKREVCNRIFSSGCLLSISGYVEVKVYIFGIHIGNRFLLNMSYLLTGLVYYNLEWTSTLEGLENYVLFLLSGGFYCLVRAH